MSPNRRVPRPTNWYDPVPVPSRKFLRLLLGQRSNVKKADQPLPKPTHQNSPVVESTSDSIASLFARCTPSMWSRESSTFSPTPAIRSRSKYSPCFPHSCRFKVRKGEYYCVPCTLQARSLYGSVNHSLERDMLALKIYKNYRKTIGRLNKNQFTALGSISCCYHCGSLMK